MLDILFMNLSYEMLPLKKKHPFIIFSFSQNVDRVRWRFNTSLSCSYITAITYTIVDERYRFVSPSSFPDQTFSRRFSEPQNPLIDVLELLTNSGSTNFEAPKSINCWVEFSILFTQKRLY